MTISRRRALVIGSSAAVAAALPACSAPAAAPPAATPAPAPSGTGRPQSPGYYRLAVGSFQVTAISDGTFNLDVAKLLLGISPSDLSSALSASFLTAPVQTSVNAYVVDTGRDLVLIDTGCGNLIAPTTGKFLANLRAAGFDPGRIGTVVFTHLHTDHIGGLLDNGATTFPDATVRILVDQDESGYWLDASRRAGARPDQQDFFTGAMTVFAPYVQQKRLQTFAPNSEVVPGVRSVALTGHTPGHTGYLVQSGSAQLLIWGDVVHAAEVQFARPDVSIEFDTTPADAAAQRRQAFQHARDGRYLIAGAHLPFPGIGHVATAGDAFRYVPIDYATY